MGEVVEALKDNGWNIITDACLMGCSATVYRYGPKATRPKSEGTHDTPDDLPAALFIAAILATQSEHTP